MIDTLVISAQNGRLAFKRAWIITRREVRDTIRDWRLMVPIGLLTLVFPALMQFVAILAQDWVRRWGAELIGERMIPFLLMIVGFFPISFSLVIALETFVGEKERYSLEPLLATPLTNEELYWGKTMAAMIPPVLASYLGLIVYLIGLYIGLRWLPDPELLALIVLLTTAEALVMVSGAVVISSQTTSVRAANILASFIIIPMTLLVQAESFMMFWGNYAALWWILAALLVVDAVLVRMGMRIFNREELLGREIDELNLGKAWRYFWRFLREPPPGTTARQKRFLPRVYAHDLPVLLRRHLLPIAVVTLMQIVAFIIGWRYALQYPLPKGLVALDVPEDAFAQIPDIGFLPSLNPWAIMTHNLRVLALEAILGLFTFGAAAIALLMVPIAIIGILAGEAPFIGASPWLLLATFILPHGIVELPAAIIATAMALRLGASIISPPPGMSLSQGVLLALADWVKVMVFLVLPMLTIAGMLEVWLTPWIVVNVW